MSNLSGQFVIGDDTPSLTYDATALGKGLIERDYAEYPVGCYGSAPPWSVDEMPLVPWDEIPDRIAHLEETKSRLSDIYQHPALDQNGQGYCHTEDTEVLTDAGFVAWSDYDWKSPLGTVSPITHRIEYQRPFEKHVYEYDGPMVYSTNRRIDFAVTPDHQMYVRKWNEKKRTLDDVYSFVKAGELGWYSGLMHSPSEQIGTEFVELEIPGDRAYDGDDFFALLGLVISDGYAGGVEKTKNWVSFASFREDIRPMVEALAARVGFKESPSRRGVWVRYDAGALAAWIRDYAYVNGETGSRAKCVPSIVKEASPRQIKHFLAWFDDRNRQGSQFYSTSKRLIDDLQELFMRIGKRSHIGVAKPKDTAYAGNKAGVISGKGGFVLTVGEVDRLCIDKKKHIETERYKGNVYCAAVPNHTLITRRNGSVLVSSNCWFYSGTSCIQVLRERNNQPYQRLSAHSGAWVIKNGRDQGGWGAQGLDFQRERGVMPISVWPEKSMNGREYNTPANWETAKEYRVTEGFVDLDPPQYNRELSVHQVISCLLNRVPVIGDFMWWRHSVAMLDVLDVYPSRSKNDPRRYGSNILNSWTDRWGTKGRGVLKDSKAWPDGASAPRAVWGN